MVWMEPIFRHNNDDASAGEREAVIGNNTTTSSTTTTSKTSLIVNQKSDADGPINNNDNMVSQHQQEQPRKEEQRESAKCVLFQTLNELERERAKRLELEAQIAALKQEQEQREKQQQRENEKKGKKKKRSSIKATTEEDHSQEGSDGTHDNDAEQEGEEEGQLVEIPTECTRRQFASLQQQVKGYQQLIHALTSGRPAIEAALNNAKHKSNALHLPLSTVRFLELVPWHPRARRAAVVTEELYEWQVYLFEGKCWSSQVANVPAFFQALPLVSPDWNGRERDTSSSIFGILSLPHTTDNLGVWTNQSITHRYELGDGYLLPYGPNTPRWKWVGAWYVDNGRDNRDDPQSNNDYDYENDKPSKPADVSAAMRDADGWSYAKEVGHFLDTTAYLVPTGASTNTTKLIHLSSVDQELAQQSQTHHHMSSKKHKHRHHSSPMVRRRKWTRTRVLVDYPFASEVTLHFLKLIAQTEEIRLTATLLHRQLIETQRALENVEQKCCQEQEMWNGQRQKLEQQLEQVQQELRQQKELLQRQKGPSRGLFSSGSPSIPQNLAKIFNDDDDDDKDDSDDDDSTVSQSSRVTTADGNTVLSSGGHHNQMLLDPKVPVADHRASSFATNCNSGRRGSSSSFFSWFDPHSKKPDNAGKVAISVAGTTKESSPPPMSSSLETGSEIAPEMGPCSDDNCSCLSESEHTAVDDDESTQFSANHLTRRNDCMQQQQQSSKSFLGMYFFKA